MPSVSPGIGLWLRTELATECGNSGFSPPGHFHVLEALRAIKWF